MPAIEPFRYVAPKRSGRSSPPPSEDSGAAPIRRRSGMRVLIVEDNWLVAIENESSLIEAGHDVVGVAVSADEAIDLCDAERPDFVLVDVRLLGDRDGVEAAIEIRERFNIPSIFLTAHKDPETVERAESARPIGWIVKPIAGQALAVRIKSLLRARN